MAGDLRCLASDPAILQQLQTFAREAPSDAVFVSKVVLFPDTPPLDEAQFEQTLWQRLQACMRSMQPSMAGTPASAATLTHRTSA